jgi:hypothetical protein
MLLNIRESLWKFVYIYFMINFSVLFSDGR